MKYIALVLAALLGYLIGRQETEEDRRRAMSAVFTLREIEEIMSSDLFIDAGAAPYDSGYARVRQSPGGGIRVLTHITKRVEGAKVGARLRVRIERADGSLIALSDDATVEWFEEHLP